MKKNKLVTYVSYVPHGISDKRYFKVNKNSSDFINFEREYGFDKYHFKLLYVNRNIRRKMPGDVILAYGQFMDGLTPEEREKCVLIFHTAPVDDNGTDLRAVCKEMIPDYPVIFTYDKGGPFNDEKMNFLFNSADVYINIASNEGFGLGSAEALTVGTPIIVNVTGGLQDQCGFKNDNGKYLTEDDYILLGSNHRGEYKEHGEWVKPVWPATISLQGSPLTPYIFDDRATSEDAGKAIRDWYDVGQSERERCGELGRQFVLDSDIGMSAPDMGKRFIESMDGAFENWKPKERYVLEEV